MEDRSVFDLISEDPSESEHYGGLPDQILDVIGAHHPAAHPIAVIHGGYWRPHFDRTYLRPLVSRLGMHVTTYNIEYRRVPGQPQWQFDDVCAALEYIAARQSAPVVIGHSAGGHLALLAAIHRPELMRACLAIAPVTDLRAAESSGADDHAVAAFLGGLAEDYPHLDPARLARPCIDYIGMHGSRDIRVPITMSQDYGDTTIQDVGHFEWVDPRTPACASVIDRALLWAEPQVSVTR